MADTGIVTGAQLADQSVNIKKLLSRLSRSLPLEYVRCQQSSSTTYDFTHPRRGLAIIISNGKFLSQEPRPYADAEIFNMQKLFKKLCFDVLSFQDLTKKQMLSVLQDAAKLKEFHHQSDCFACVIGSHGAEISSGLNNHSALNTKKHVIYGTDDHVDTNRLTDLFSDSNCPGLRHKPKLFFIQACRKDSTAPPESGLDIGIDINITSGQPPTSTHPHIFALYEPRGTPTLSRHDRLGSVNKVETVEFGREFDSSKKDTEAAFKDNTNIIKNETPSSQAEMSPISPTENSTSLSSPEGNEMNPISPKENSTSLSSPEGNEMSPISPKGNGTSLSSPEGNGMSPTLQESTAECLTSTKDTTSLTSPKDIDTKPTDHLEFRNALSRFLHLNPSIDEQVSPVCRPNFMIMYSSPQDMFSFGRREDGGMTRAHNPVVGGFLLHSLYSVVVRENLFVRQRTPEGLDMLDVFTRVNDFGLKNLIATIELPVGRNEEDKQRFCVKCAFALEHRLVDDVIFRHKGETSL